MVTLEEKERPKSTEEPEPDSPVEKLTDALADLRSQIDKYDDLVTKLADAKAKSDAAKTKLHSVESQNLDDVDPLSENALKLIAARSDSKKLHVLRQQAEISEALVGLFEKSIVQKQDAVFKIGNEAVKHHQQVFCKCYAEIAKAGERLLAEHFEVLSYEVEQSYRPLIQLSYLRMDSTFFQLQMSDDSKINMLRTVFDKSAKLIAMVETSE
jgi:hypothetical protein